jgi:hypothetical protein
VQNLDKNLDILFRRLYFALYRCRISECLNFVAKNTKSVPLKSSKRLKKSKKYYVFRLRMTDRHLDFSLKSSLMIDSLSGVFVLSPSPRHNGQPKYETSTRSAYSSSTRPFMIALTEHFSIRKRQQPSS